MSLFNFVVYKYKNKLVIIKKSFKINEYFRTKIL